MKTFEECARAYCEAKDERIRLRATYRKCEQYTDPSTWPCWKDTRLSGPAEFCEPCRWNLEHYVPNAQAIRERLPGLMTATLRAYRRDRIAALAAKE